jgi:hypothetical protein
MSKNLWRKMFLKPVCFNFVIFIGLFFFSVIWCFSESKIVKFFTEVFASITILQWISLSILIRHRRRKRHSILDV